MVEVFKTNIACETVANEVSKGLSKLFPNYKVNFDLEDCDRILRIEAENIPIALIKDTVQNMGLICEVLE